MVPNQQPKPEKSKRYLYPLAVLISLAVILSSGSLIGFFYVAWQSRIDLEQSQQKHKQDRADWHQLDQASEAAAKGDYRTCVAKLSDVSAQSPYQRRTSSCSRPFARRLMPCLRIPCISTTPRTGFPVAALENFSTCRGRISPSQGIIRQLPRL